RDRRGGRNRAARRQGCRAHGRSARTIDVMDQKLAIAVLVSGRGSNLSALLNAIDAGTCQAEVRGVVSDRPEAPALELARARNLPVRVVKPKDYPSREAWDAALAACVEALAPELVV